MVPSERLQRTRSDVSEYADKANTRETAMHYARFALTNTGERSAPIRRLPMVIVVFVGASIGYADPVQSIRFRKVAETGMPAPGTEPGVIFDALTTPLNQNLLIPKMDALGRVAFTGLLAGPGIKLANFQGMWAEQDGALRLVARNGQPAPGTEQGVLFRGVPSLEIPFAPEGGGINIAFHAQLIGPGVDVTNDEGIWKGGPESLALVAREGSAPPGLPGLTLGVPIVTTNGVGHVLLRTSLHGAGVDDTNREALLSDRSGVLELVLREGNPAPSTEPGTVFGGNAPFARLLINDNSDLALGVTLAGPAVGDLNDQALYVERNGLLQLVLREGDPAPGVGSGVTFGGNTPDSGLSSLAFNHNGRLAFRINLGGAAPTQPGLFSDRTGALDAVAISGQPAPGTDFDYSFFGAPILNEVNQIAFSAAFPDDGDIFTPPPFGVFSDVDGSIALVVAPGDTTLDGEIITDARVIAFNRAGQMLLSLQVDSVTSRTGFWLRDRNGAIHRLAATGDPFDLNGDGNDVRQVIRVVSGGMNEAGQVAIRLDFVDGESAHFVASVPCQPDTRPDLCAAFVDNQPNDFDLDGDLDLIDFRNFQRCFGASADQRCLCSFDIDLDCSVDLFEFHGFQSELTGPQ